MEEAAATKAGMMACHSEGGAEAAGEEAPPGGMRFTQFFKKSGGAEAKAAKKGDLEARRKEGEEREARKKTRKKQKKTTEEEETEDPVEVSSLLASWDRLRTVSKSLEKMGVEPLRERAVCGAVPELSGELWAALPKLVAACPSVVEVVEDDTTGRVVVFHKIDGRPAIREKKRRATMRTALLAAHFRRETGASSDNNKRQDSSTSKEEEEEPREKAHAAEEPNGLIRYLMNAEWYEGQAAHVERVEARSASYGACETALSFDLEALTRGKRLYAHQARAIDAALAGKHVIVATGTASGKSLAYKAATFDAARRNPGKCVALYLFPTKALAQDQLQHITHDADLLDTAHDVPITATALDGDSGYSHRDDVADAPPTVVVTNPDMLHYTVLAEPRWKKLLTDLAIVVVDEAHVYVGAFGAHVACVLRRLRRLCEKSGSSPVFFAASATVANPRHHASSLLPLRPDDLLEVVDHDASPRNPKAVVVWNPPFKKNGGAPSVPGATTSHPESSRDDENWASSRRDDNGVTRSQQMSEGQSPSEDAGGHGKRKKRKVRQRWRDNTILEEPSEKNSPSNDDDDVVMEPALLDAEEKAKRSRLWRERRQLVADMETTENRDPFEKRRSSIYETARVFARFVQNGTRCLCFGRTRKLVELVLGYAKELLDEKDRAKIAAYRGGYDKAERRAIEAGLFGGSLIGVVATCALELGVDVGDLDATVHLGHPGSIASLWQQAGRAGRRPGAESVAVVVCWDSPMDQQFARCGSRLLNRPLEASALDVGNERVLRAHLKCAAAEHPLDPSTDRALFSAPPALVVVPPHSSGGESSSSHHRDSNDDQDDQLPRSARRPVSEDEDDAGVLKNNNIRRSAFDSALAELERRGDVLRTGRHGLYPLHPGADSRPQKKVNLRMIDPVSFQVKHSATGAVLDEVPYSRAFYELFQGAIYLHQARPYLITKLDLIEYVATAKPLRHCAYHTSARNHTDVDPAHVLDAWAGFCRTGYVHVKREVWGYKRVCKRTGKVLSLHEFTLPPLEFDTRGTWIDLPSEALDAVGGETNSVESTTKKSTQREHSLSAAVHALNHAIVNVAPLFVIADRNDFDTEHVHPLQKRPRPFRVVLYDARPGGVGVADAVFRRMDAVLTEALHLLSKCPCHSSTGCPSCLFCSSCPAHNVVLDKTAAVAVLKVLLRILKVESITAQPGSPPSTRKRRPALASPDSPDKVNTDTTPRRALRARALRRAAMMDQAAQDGISLRQVWAPCIPNFRPSE